MKDSSAAPTPSSVATPRGKTAAPKARAKAVAKAKARAKTKNTPLKSPSASTPVGTASAPRAPIASAPVEAALAPPLAATAPVEAPQDSSSETITPEIPFAAALAPKSEATQAAVTKAVNAQLAANTPAAARPASAPAATSPQSVTASGVASALADAPKTPAPPGAACAKASKSSSPNDVASKTSRVAPATAPRGAVPSGVAPKASSVAPATAPVVSAPVATRPAFGLRPLHVGAALLALVTTVAGGVAVGSYNNWSNSQLIAPNVRVAGEPVGGLTREQATERLDKRFGKLAFTLQTGDKNVVLGVRDIGGKPSIGPTVDKAYAIGRDGNAINNFARVFGAEVKPRAFSLPIEWNRGALTSRLGIVNQQYALAPTDARLVTVSGDAPRVTLEQSGRALDVSATADAIEKRYFLGLAKVKAVTREVAPRVRATDLAGRDVKLGEYRTSYDGGITGRTTNIHVACRAIDGTVLMPGEVLSFNGLTGERTYRKGYRMAHIFVREKGQSESSVVDGLAGGVCQVSSTLYNAVRKINQNTTGTPLSIVERSSHSLPVAYVPSGRDATVAWPHKDFKFRNSNAFPVYVRTSAGNGRLIISIWGRVPFEQTVAAEN